MSENKRSSIYFFIGTTAELIKLAPVISELKKRKIVFKIIASNQNTLHFNELKPLIGRQSADYTFIITRFIKLKNIYIRFVWWSIKSFVNYLLYFLSEFKGLKKKNVIFIVHGDTVTSFIGALIAKLCRVKLIHIESGLRSFNFFEPFPEEINRFVISWLSDVHFCPNKWAISNLKNHPGVKINTFYNTVGESTMLGIKQKAKLPVGLKQQKYFVLVLHRQEHTLFHKSDTAMIIENILKNTNGNLKCVFIMHHLTKDYLRKKGNLFSKIKRNTNVILPERLSYLSFVNLIDNAEFIATDGGSNQEEAYFLGKPCLILRGSTERIEGLGENAVLGKNDVDVISNFISNYKTYKRKRHAIKKSPSKIIVDYLSKTI